MEIRPIRTKKQYEEALKAAELLWEAKPGTPEAEHLEVLALLIEAYETKHFPVPDPDPIEFLLHVMESRGLCRKDLEPYLGGRARVAEVLNRVRPLTLEMIRRLSEGMGLPADVLVKRYEIRRAA